MPIAIEVLRHARVDGSELRFDGERPEVERAVPRVERDGARELAGFEDLGLPQVRGDRAVLVVANLGTTTLAGVTLSSPERVLPAGRYTPKALLGAPSAASLRVGPDGRIQGYVPLGSLAPLTGYLFDLSAAGR